MDNSLAVLTYFTELVICVGRDKTYHFAIREVKPKDLDDEIMEEFKSVMDGASKCFASHWKAAEEAKQTVGEIEQPIKCFYKSGFRLDIHAVLGFLAVFKIVAFQQDNPAVLL